jgi:hypothetical protein
MMGEGGAEQRARGGEYTSGAGAGWAGRRASDAKRGKKLSGSKICNLGLPERPLRILASIPFWVREP